jgi:hypothetical protein
MSMLSERIPRWRCWGMEESSSSGTGDQIWGCALGWDALVPIQFCDLRPHRPSIATITCLQLHAR